MKTQPFPKQRTPLVLLALVALTLCLSACGETPPANVSEAANALPTRITALRSSIDPRRTEYQNLLKQSEYSFMEPYTNQQKHLTSFDQASRKLDEADSLYGSRVKPVIDSYDPAKLEVLEAGITDTEKLNREAEALINDPPQWAPKVLNTKNHTQEVTNTAESDAQAIVDGHGSLRQTASDFKERYKKQIKSIDDRFQSFTALLGSTNAALENFRIENRKGQPNYADLTTYAETVAENKAQLDKDGPAFRATLAELDVSETHTLIDIRVDSFVVINRSSWQGDSDNELVLQYQPIAVDLETAEYFAQFLPNEDHEIATVTQGNKLEVKVDRGHWDKLRLDPQKEWRDGDTDASYSVEDIDDIYCHQLRVIRNGEFVATPIADDYCSNRYNKPDEVSQGMSWRESDDIQSEDIGMDIYSKGQGDFVAQATFDATPPGMLYVDNPAYGQWQADPNDSNGSFWIYYGKYRFYQDLIGGTQPYHCRHEYNDWNRSYRYAQRPYYSSIGNQRRYGGESPLVQARFPNSYYYRTGLHNLTVRNAGPAARSGGPGGGGK